MQAKAGTQGKVPVSCNLKPSKKTGYLATMTTEKLIFYMRKKIKCKNSDKWGGIDKGFIPSFTESSYK